MFRDHNQRVCEQRDAQEMTPHDVDAMEDEAMSKSSCEFKKYCRYEGKGDECTDADYQLYCDQKEGFSEMEYDHAGEMIARAKRTKRQNPDPKQYAKREELDKEIERILTIGSADGTFTMTSLEYRNGLVKAQELINNHGLEE